MKKLNLNKTWEQCLKMWRWIVRQPCPRGVFNLKRKWLEKNGFYGIKDDCFFCDYKTSLACSNCPGYKVDKDFQCENSDYHYAWKPAAFLRKITKLNEKRLSNKKRRKR